MDSFDKSHCNLFHALYAFVVAIEWRSINACVRLCTPRDPIREDMARITCGLRVLDDMEMRCALDDVADGLFADGEPRPFRIKTAALNCAHREQFFEFIDSLDATYAPVGTCTCTATELAASPDGACQKHCREREYEVQRVMH
jgi:hypothetical protein